MSAEIGRQLREARQAQGLTLEQAAAETFIRPQYLQALEEGRFDALPSPVQVRGFLRNYAAFLHLDAGALLAALDHSPSPSPDEPPPPESQTPPAPELDIPELGVTLRQRREMLGISLDEVARHTHIPRHYLEALENGELGRLPSSVQGSGMLKNYAAFLDLDPEPLLLRFAEALQERLQQRLGRPPGKVTQQEEVPRQPGALQRIFSREVLLSGTLIVLLISLLVWGGAQVLDRQAASQPSPSPPSIADVLLPSPTVTLAPTPTITIPSPLDIAAEAAAAAPAETAPPEATELPVGAVQTQIITHQRAFLRVLVDGEEVFNGRVVPGSVYAFAGDESVEILTGNAAALEVLYNGQNLGLLGSQGEVVNTIYTLSGVLTPTPTNTPTPTETPRFSPTPSPTPSSTPTP